MDDKNSNSNSNSVLFVLLLFVGDFEEMMMSPMVSGSKQLWLRIPPSPCFRLTFRACSASPPPPPPATAAGVSCPPDYLSLSNKELFLQCSMDTFRASGPGGQHRNKTESAVRLTHLPTGLVSQVTLISLHTYTGT